MNTVKYETYKNEMINLDKAIKFGFYLEAISISYAAIEDRLNSFLIHIGLVNNKEKLKVNKRFNYLYKYLLKKDENERNCNGIFFERSVFYGWKHRLFEHRFASQRGDTCKNGSFYVFANKFGDRSFKQRGGVAFV
jgi:hypothetical protein